jgi:hypothetical protein
MVGPLPVRPELSRADSMECDLVSSAEPNPAAPASVVSALPCLEGPMSDYGRLDRLAEKESGLLSVVAAAMGFDPVAFAKLVAV